MKLVINALLALFLLRGFAADFCKRPLMKAYMLDGLLEPNQDKNPLCPSIKNNCCTSADMVLVYDKYTQNLVPKMHEYKDKFLSSIRRLRALHQSVYRLKPKEEWQGTQLAFCQTRYLNFTNFGFNEMIDEMVREFAVVQPQFQTIHTSFLCVFCDYDAHLEMMLSTRVAGIDSNICIEALNIAKPLIIAQTVRLLDYLQRLQALLDCQFFDKKFNLPFPFSTEQGLAKDFTACFEKLTPESLDDKCAPLCKNLNFGAFSPVFEGNYHFIFRSTEYFSNLIDSIGIKQNMTAFDPLSALRALNKENPLLRFNRRGNVSRQRKSFMSEGRNKFTLGDNSFDDTFRNDETNYPSNPSDDTIDDDAMADPNAITNFNINGWENYYRPKGMNGGVAVQTQQFQQGTSNIFDQGLKALQGGLNDAANLGKSVGEGLQNAAAGVANAVSGAASNLVSGAANVIGGLFRRRRWLKEDLASKWYQRGMHSWARPKWMEDQVLQETIARRLQQTGGATIPVVDHQGRLILLKNGDKLPNGISNVNGVIYKNGKPLINPSKEAEKLKKIARKERAAKKAKAAAKARKLEIAKKEQEIKEAKLKAEAVAKAQELQAKNALKLAKSLVRKEEKLKKQKEEKKDLKDIEKVLEKKLGKKLSIKVATPKKSSKESTLLGLLKKENQESQSASQVLESDAIKTLLGKKEVPEAEQKLLEKMAKMIDSQFSSKSTKRILSDDISKSAKLYKNKRVLENLFAEEEAEDAIHLGRGRVLQGLAQDPLLQRNPIKYYQKYYDSIEPLQNSTSQEIYKPSMETIDFLYFERKFVFNQGVDLRGYMSSLGFGIRRGDLLIVLAGKSNRDKFDGQMHELNKTLDRNFQINMIRNLFSEYTAQVMPERMSEDDKEFLSMEPTYDADEQFDTIPLTYFDDSVAGKLDTGIPNAFIIKRTVPNRRLTQTSAGSENESSEVMRELMNAIRPANLRADRRSLKEVF